MSPKVLIIEASAAIRRLLTIAITKSGGSVTEANGTQPALDALASGGFDAVFIDVPSLSGDAELLVSRLNSGPGPRWVVSSAIDRTSVETVLGSLGEHFVAKPFDILAVAAVLVGLAPMGLGG